MLFIKLYLLHSLVFTAIISKTMAAEMPEENEVIAKLDLDEPPQHILDWAKENIKENPETRDQAISEFRDAIFSRGEVTPHRSDDEYLLRFLRCRNFSLEAAHKLMVNYYEFKENNTEYFEGISLDHLKDIGEDNIIIVPPYREQTGRRILLYRLGNWDPEKIEVVDLFRASLVILQASMVEPINQVLGGICIFDCENVALQHAWYMTPSIAHKIFQIAVTSMPIKVHAIHIVNTSWIFDTSFNIFKPFLSARMRERIHIHKDFTTLHEHIDPKYLPKKYGGEQKEFSCYEWYHSARKNVKLLKELKALGYSDDEEEAKLPDEIREQLYKN